MSRAQLLPAARASVSAGSVHWTPGGSAEAAPPRLLLAFLTLDLEDAAAVERFVIAHGALALCTQHRLPRTHSPVVYGVPSKPCSPKWSTRRDRQLPPTATLIYEEPLSAWARWQLEALLILRLAEEVRSGADQLPDTLNALREAVEGAPTAEERAWESEIGAGLDVPVSFDQTSPLTAGNPDAADIEDVQELLARLLSNRWLRLGDVRTAIKLRYRGEDRRAALEPVVVAEGLFAALALELAGEVERRLQGTTTTRRLDPVTCAGCGQPFIPRRRPGTGRLSWCPQPECRQARSRHTSQTNRDRQRR